MKLHHGAYTITKGNSILLEDLYIFLGAKLIWEGTDQGREIAMQFDNGFSLQFSAVDVIPISDSNKKETHIAFSSTSPVKDLQKIQE